MWLCLFACLACFDLCTLWIVLLCLCVVCLSCLFGLPVINLSVCLRRLVSVRMCLSVYVYLVFLALIPFKKQVGKAQISD